VKLFGLITKVNVPEVAMVKVYQMEKCSTPRQPPRVSITLPGPVGVKDIGVFPQTCTFPPQSELDWAKKLWEIKIKKIYRAFFIF
jgi:hypothetical protein